MEITSATQKAAKSPAPKVRSAAVVGRKSAGKERGRAMNAQGLAMTKKWRLLTGWNEWSELMG
jgi:hypothetical protein